MPGDDEPDSGTLDRAEFGTQPVERLKQFLELLFRNAGAGVPHPDTQQIVRQALQHHIDAATLVVVLDRISQQIQEHLLQADSVSLHVQAFEFGLVKVDFDCPVLRQRQDPVNAVVEHLPQRNRLQRNVALARLDAR